MGYRMRSASVSTARAVVFGAEMVVRVHIVGLLG